MTTYALKVTYKDGTGHTYKNLSRSKVGALAATQFSSGYDRPETVTITTERASGYAPKKTYI